MPCVRWLVEVELGSQSEEELRRKSWLSFWSTWFVWLNWVVWWLLLLRRLNDCWWRWIDTTETGLNIFFSYTISHHSYLAFAIISRHAPLAQVRPSPPTSPDGVARFWHRKWRGEWGHGLLFPPCTECNICIISPDFHFGVLYQLLDTANSNGGVEIGLRCAGNSMTLWEWFCFEA